jgi:putative lipoic acid-binding regulatory protein
MTKDNENCEEDTLFEFPCEFPIKVMGADEDKLSEVLREALQRYSPECIDREFKLRPSSKGRFVGITVTITATSKAQLDAIYQALTDSKEVLIAL